MMITCMVPHWLTLRAARSSTNGCIAKIMSSAPSHVEFLNLQKHLLAAAAAPQVPAQYITCLCSLLLLSPNPSALAEVHCQGGGKA